MKIKIAKALYFVLHFLDYFILISEGRFRDILKFGIEIRRWKMENIQLKIAYMKYVMPKDRGGRRRNERLFDVIKHKAYKPMCSMSMDTISAQI